MQTGMHTDLGCPSAKQLLLGEEITSSVTEAMSSLATDDTSLLQHKPAFMKKLLKCM